MPRQAQDPSVFELTLHLKPGTYQYKFIVDKSSPELYWEFEPGLRNTQSEGVTLNVVDVLEPVPASRSVVPRAGKQTVSSHLMLETVRDVKVPGNRSADGVSQGAVLQCVRCKCFTAAGSDCCSMCRVNLLASAAHVLQMVWQWSCPRCTVDNTNCLLCSACELASAPVRLIVDEVRVPQSH
jgi:hypothetical protein